MAKGRGDVIVIGGGIAGLSIAWELLRRGAAVTLLRSARPAASPVAAGMLAPMAEVAINPALGRLAIDALRHYPEFLEALANDTDRTAGFVRSGVMRLAYGDAEAEALRETVGQYEAAGMPSRWLGPASAAREVPGLALDGLSGGLLSFDEAQVQPAWLLAALEAAIAVRDGVVVDAQVESLRESGDGVEVRAGDLALSADHAVLAMGSWSGGLAGMEQPVSPVKGQLLVFGVGSPGPSRILYRGRHYLLTKADQTVVLGATMEADAGFSVRPDARADELRALLPGFWPALVGLAATARAGLRPAAPDGMPLVGGLPARPRSYAFTAHFRNGFLLAPYSAGLAADEILERREAPLLRGMRPARFAARAG